MTEENKFRYSEIFHSFQGEGFYTGRNTAWIRFFMCNLQCSGFGQKDPTDPSTYILPYKDFDVSTIDKVEDLPVWEFGCDSSYTWAKKYKHLMANETAKEICDKLSACFVTASNPHGLFQHPITKQHAHLAFTGGEPMLNQQAMREIITTFQDRKNAPHYVTVETNGTQPFRPDVKLNRMISTYYNNYPGYEWFWSVSPKLFSTSGEKYERAIKPQVVAEYARASNKGQLKYVVNGSDQSWEDVERATEAFRNAGVNWDVYIMPVGATKEQQEGNEIAEIAMDAMRRGYHVSGRLHCYVFGNQIGT